MIATDTVGTRRVVVAVPAISGNGLVAIQFQRVGETKDRIPIQFDDTGTKKMFLELGPKVGTLVLRGDQYRHSSGLLE